MQCEISEEIREPEPLNPTIRDEDQLTNLHCVVVFTYAAT